MDEIELDEICPKDWRIEIPKDNPRTNSLIPPAKRRTSKINIKQDCKPYPLGHIFCFLKHWSKMNI